MKRYRPALPGLALLALTALALAGCGPKRPPAVTGPGAARAAPGGTASRTPAEPVEPGPDLRPVESEPGMGVDVPGSGEGGPLADVHFAFDSAALSDEARGLLEKHALWLQNHRDIRMTVEGHCDERGTVEYNLALGDQRARAAREYLVSLGVAGGRLTAVSFGKERPLDPGHGEDAWARNRRAHFAVAR